LDAPRETFTFYCGAVLKHRIRGLVWCPKKKLIGVISGCGKFEKSRSSSGKAKNQGCFVLQPRLMQKSHTYCNIHLLGQFIIGTISRISKVGTALVVGVSSFNLQPRFSGAFFLTGKA
jgi:hypothetical protein